MPGETLERKLCHEGVRIEFLNVVHTGFFPFSCQEHLCAYHGGHSGGVAHRLHAGFLVGFLVAAIVVYVVCQRLAVFVKTADAASD